MFLRLFIILSFIFIQASMLAQGSLKGVVLFNDEPIPFVNLTLIGTNIGAATNLKGEFLIENIPEGEYNLTAKYLGYKSITKVVEVKNGETLQLELIMLKDMLGLNQVTVTANRGAEDRKTSTVIVSVLNKEQLERISANTFSDGIKYSPGIRSESNCQNCGFSQVRINGLPGAYSQILIDGRATFSALNSIYGLEQIPIK